jgi:HlyD family secretion protein
VRIEVWAEDNVLRVPAGAVFRRGEGWAVFVVESGRARRRDVTVGRRNGREVQILRGVRDQETVLVHASDTIDDGVAVQPM